MDHRKTLRHFRSVEETLYSAWHAPDPQKVAITSHHLKPSSMVVSLSMATKAYLDYDWESKLDRETVRAKWLNYRFVEVDTETVGLVRRQKISTDLPALVKHQATNTGNDSFVRYTKTKEKGWSFDNPEHHVHFLHIIYCINIGAIDYPIYFTGHPKDIHYEAIRALGETAIEMVCKVENNGQQYTQIL